MMEVKQAFSIIAQAIDVAVAGGTFKASRDVAVVDQAKQVLAQYIDANEPSGDEEPEAKTLKKSK